MADGVTYKREIMKKKKKKERAIQDNEKRTE